MQLLDFSSVDTLPTWLQFVVGFISLVFFSLFFLGTFTVFLMFTEWISKKFKDLFKKI